ncbi:MAG: class I SAM-dependent methyltransferase [Desulfobulbaceae bacterium]|nr:class I SAM-dependent methyltransferase [Desulfobulbaceae bacterium]HIJ79887.1 class I SAM-dependent methyltransferase [Deltaproteobacteria bacterium]
MFVENNKSMLGKLKNRLSFLGKYPVHPQWFCQNSRKLLEKTIKHQITAGTVIDLGCAGKWPAGVLPANCKYYGLDYLQTAKNLYQTTPDIYGDAQCLPLASESADYILLLDVLEHLQSPELTIREIKRVLKTNGSLILNVPFIYPIHDAPLDFHRWTPHGLDNLAQKNDFSITTELSAGSQLQTAAVISNIAMTKSVLDWIEKKHPAALLILILPFYILFNNLLGWLLGMANNKKQIISLSTIQVWKKG